MHSGRFLYSYQIDQAEANGFNARFIDLAYEQALFEDRFNVRLGRIAANNDFLTSPYYSWAFLQNGINGTLSASSSIPTG